MTWTEPATQLVNRAPDFARGIARTTIHRWAMERGHSVITTKVVEDAMATILPESAMKAMGIIAENVAVERIESGNEETYICSNCGYAARGFKPAACSVCGGAAEQFQLLDKEAISNLVPLEGGVEEEETFDHVKLEWTSEARALLREVPQGYQKRRTKAQIEKTARVRRLPTITRELVMEVADITLEETQNLSAKGELKKRPPGDAANAAAGQELIKDGEFSWTAEAMIRLKRVPEGFMRNITKGRIEECAAGKKVSVITLAVAEEGIAVGRKIMEETISSYKKENPERKPTQ